MKVAALLTDLLSLVSCQRAFQRKAPVLAVPAFDRPVKLAVDPIGAVAGAVLHQEEDDRVGRPVSCLS